MGGRQRELFASKPLQKGTMYEFNDMLSMYNPFGISFERMTRTDSQGNS